MSIDNVNNILENVLFEFPIKEINIELPGWVEGLEGGHWLKSRIVSSVKVWGKEIGKINDVRGSVKKLLDEVVSDASLNDIELGQGVAHISMKTKEGLFYNVLEEITGYKIRGIINFSV